MSPLPNAEFLDQRLPTNRVVITDAAHFVWQEAPAKYASAVLHSITGTGYDAAQARPLQRRRGGPRSSKRKRTCHAQVNNHFADPDGRTRHHRRDPGAGLVVGIWAAAAGFAEIFAAVQGGETAGARAMFVLGGLVSVAFGVVLFARPGIGAATLALLFGLLALIYGVSQITTSIQLSHSGRALHSVTRDAV